MISMMSRVHRLVHGERRAEHEEPLDDVVGGHAEGVGEVADGDTLGDRDGALGELHVSGVRRCLVMPGLLDLLAGLLVLLLLSACRPRPALRQRRPWPPR